MASALVQKGCIPQAMDCYAAALRIDPNVASPAAPHQFLDTLRTAPPAAGKPCASDVSASSVPDAHLTRPKKTSFSNVLQSFSQLQNNWPSRCSMW